MATTSPRHVTIAEVARTAGVNSSTVSRVLNGIASVRPETRRRIEEAVELLGYRPSHSARSLVSARTWSIGVLLPDIQNLMHIEFLRGAEHIVQQFGYSLLIADGQLSPDIQAAALDRFLQMRVDGMIVSRAFSLPPLLEPFARAQVPVEPVEVYADATAETAMAARSGRQGSHAAFARMFGLGHYCAALFVHERADAPERSPEMNARIGALLAAKDDVRGKKPTVHLAGVSRESECYDQLARLLACTPRPTVLISGNDWMTAPLLGAIRDADLTIPDDVSFLTYGDSRWAAAYRPPISVIRYDYYGEGQTLAARVLRQLGEPVDHTIADKPLASDEFIDRGSLHAPQR